MLTDSLERKAHDLFVMTTSVARSSAHLRRASAPSSVPLSAFFCLIVAQFASPKFAAPDLLMYSIGNEFEQQREHDHECVETG